MAEGLKITKTSQLQHSRGIDFRANFSSCSDDGYTVFAGRAPEGADVKLNGIKLKNSKAPVDFFMNKNNPDDMCIEGPLDAEIYIPKGNVEVLGGRNQIYLEDAGNLYLNKSSSNRITHMGKKENNVRLSKDSEYQHNRTTRFANGIDVEKKIKELRRK